MLIDVIVYGCMALVLWGCLLESVYPFAKAQLTCRIFRNAYFKINGEEPQCATCPMRTSCPYRDTAATCEFSKNKAFVTIYSERG